MNITFRLTTPDDLPFLMACEADADARPYISPWNAEQHVAAIDSPDCRHIVFSEPASGREVGFAMLFGLQSPHHSIELRRIVCSVKGQGVGRAAIEALKGIAFDELRAHRFWLDVKVSNARAQRLYRAAGFVEEGCLRECLLEAGRYESLLIMSLLRSEMPG